MPQQHSATHVQSHPWGSKERSDLFSAGKCRRFSAPYLGDRSDADSAEHVFA
jgi:hypothetical protein